MDAEEKTAHEVRRLKSSVQDLQNALRLASCMDAPVRPSREALASPLVEPSGGANPYSHILANNDRGVLHGIERLQDIGVAVIGLNGIGALTAEAFTRYGVKSLLLLDNAEIALSDLSYMQFQAQDVGRRKDERLALALRKLNPDVKVHAAGVALGAKSCSHDILRVLRTAATRGRRWMTTDANAMGGSEEENDMSDSEDLDEEDDEDEGFNDEEGQEDTETGSDSSLSLDLDGARAPKVLDASASKPNHLLHVVFLCVPSGELASALNEFCCEFGVLFVFVFVGGNGISGEILSVEPGRSSCLQCFEKRKIFKATSTPPGTQGVSGDATEDQSQQQQQQQQGRSQPTRLRPCLPSTECILSGIGVQNAVMQLLGFGSFCSRVEYDGLLEEMNRSGFLSPVHQCPSAFCRLQQQTHSK